MINIQKIKSRFAASSIFIVLLLLLVASTFYFFNAPKPALAANYYWIGGAVGHTNEWNWAGNWGSSSGTGAGAGVPGAGDTAIFDNGSAVNCTLNVSPSIGSIINTNYAGTLAISTYTLTLSGDFQFKSGTLNGGSGGIITGGNLDINGTTFTYSTSTITLNGISTTFDVGSNQFYKLTVDGTVSPTVSNAIVNNTLTVNANKTLTIGSGRTITMVTASATTINGIIDGTGLLILTQSAGANLSATGTINCPVRFANSAVTAYTIPARNFGADVELYVGASNMNVTLGAGTFNFAGNFTVTQSGAGRIYLNFRGTDHSNNTALAATVNVAGNLTVTGGGTTYGFFYLGSAPVTISGDLDLRPVQLSINDTLTTTTGWVQSKIIMNGNNKTLYNGFANGGNCVNSQGYYDLQFSASTTIASSATPESSAVCVFHRMTVDTGTTLTIAAAYVEMQDAAHTVGATTYVTGGPLLDVQGTVTGTGYIEMWNAHQGSITDTGIISCDLVFNNPNPDIDDIAGFDYPMFDIPARTFGGNVTITFYGGGGSYGDVVFGTAAGQTINFAQSLYVISRTGNAETLSLNSSDYNPSINIAGDFDSNNNRYVLYNMGSSTWEISGNTRFQGMVTAGASTLQMDGTDKTFYIASYGTSAVLYNLQISGTISLTSSGSYHISHDLLIDSGAIYKLGWENSDTFMDEGATIHNSGEISSDESVIIFIEPQANVISGDGPINAPIWFESLTKDFVLPAYHYDSLVSIRNYHTGVAHTAVMGTAAGQSFSFKDLHINSIGFGTGDMTLDASVNNPTVTISDDLDLAQEMYSCYSGGYYSCVPGESYLKMGSGTWTVGPKVDLTDANIDHQTSTVVAYTPAQYPWAHIGDANESGIAGCSGFNCGVILSSAVYNGELYVGGGFTYIDGQQLNYIAKWNGTSWSAVGTGMDDSVLALTVFDGKLIAGGYFMNAGGVPVIAVAAWDGSNWSAMPGLTDWSQLDALTIHNGELYGGGYFDQYVTGVVKWTGSTWEAVGNDSLYNYGEVYALASYGGKLIAGGYSFYINDGVIDSSIVAWDGANWTELGGDVMGVSNSAIVYSLYPFGGDLIVGGDFSYVGGDINTGLGSMYVAAWNGTGWESMSLDDGVIDPNETQDYVGAMTTFNGELVIAGEFTRDNHAVADNIASWDGDSWVDMGNPYFPFLTLAVYDNDLIASGHGFNYGTALVPIFGYSPDAPGATHTVTINKAGNGNGTFNQSSPQVVADGADFSVSATPDANSNFVSWSGCDVVGGAACVLENITTDKTITATFTLKEGNHSVTVEKTGNGDGGFDSATYQVVSDGANVTVTAIPSGNSRFISWSGCDSTNGTVCNLADITEDKVIVATFVKDSGTSSGTSSDTSGLGLLPDTGKNGIIALAVSGLALLIFFAIKRERALSK